MYQNLNILIATIIENIITIIRYPDDHISTQKSFIPNRVVEIDAVVYIDEGFFSDTDQFPTVFLQYLYRPCHVYTAVGIGPFLHIRLLVGPACHAYNDVGRLCSVYWALGRPCHAYRAVGRPCRAYTAIGRPCRAYSAVGKHSCI